MLSEWVILLCGFELLYSRQQRETSNLLLAVSRLSILSWSEHPEAAGVFEHGVGAAQVRAQVAGIKARLDQGLELLAAAASGSPPWTAQHLEVLAPLATRLLGSQLVGEGAAWDGAAALARCLPPLLRSAAPAVASALRLVALQEATGEEPTLECLEHVESLPWITAPGLSSSLTSPKPEWGALSALRWVDVWPRLSSRSQQLVNWYTRLLGVF